MSNRPNFIEGIYNYCDYICEKCVYPSQCYLYWSERNPDEAEKDLEKAAEKWAEYVGDVEIDEEWQESFEDRQRREQEEERAEKIVAPSREIINIAHPMLKELFDDHYDNADSHLKEAIDHISINHMLISAKYYRAIHDLPDSTEDEIDELIYWGLEDSEKTFLAMKGFLWNLKFGCKVLAEELPIYQERCQKITRLANVIFERIENEHLPLVQTLIINNRERFEEDE